MTSHLVITLVAEDKPGLVEQLSQTIADHDSSWQESRMARMAGQFAGILLVDAPDAKTESLTAAINALSSKGIHAQVKQCDSGLDTTQQQQYQLSLVGNDRPGIVKEMSQALASRGINVEELHTECKDAPMSGGMMFHASALLLLPESIEPETVKDELEELANDFMVDITRKTKSDS